MLLRLMVIEDLPKILEIRNDPETYNYLHTPKPFNLDECITWFTKNNPIWYIIEEDQNIIGYIRTSEWDFINKSIMIGCDIHKNYRRKGYAFLAYTKFIENLKKCGWNTITLSVLKTNINAIKLYEKLNFKVISNTQDSYNMELKINDNLNTKKGAKVIACYFGNRRSTGTAGRGPYTAKDAYSMYKFIWKNECENDQGYPHDTIFVINELLSTDPIDNQQDVDICTSLIESFNNCKTKNGIAKVLKRPNIGLSFGAFDHAFNELEKDYDYWLFTEDDQIIVAENVYKTALKQLLLPNETTNGYIATVGVNRSWGPGAFGGCGFSSREILNKVVEKHYSEYHKRNCLPFYYVQNHTANVPQTTESHEWYGEVAFTLSIHQMGYYLEDHEMPFINVSWGDTERRTFRCRPFEQWMDISKTNKINKIHMFLRGEWRQENGDKFVVEENICKFNNDILGYIDINDEKYIIKWDNYISYFINHNDIIENKNNIQIIDSNQNIINITKI